MIPRTLAQLPPARAARRVQLAGALAGALVGLLVGTCACDAGVVVLKNGNVIVGKVSRDPETGDVLVRWPHGSQRKTGKLLVPAHTLRWANPDQDVLSDDYFREHLDAPLQGALWLRMLEEYKLRQERRGDDDQGPLIVPTSLDPLALPAIDAPGFRLRKPRGWGASLQEGILILQAPPEGGRGFQPRIHAFAVEGVEESPSAQVGWVQAELGRLEDATAGRAEFRLLGSVEMSAAGGETQARFVSETLYEGLRVRALRRLVFRGGKTYVLCAYADGPDFAAHEGLFRACLDSLEP